MWYEFRKRMDPYLVFSITDIRKEFPGFSNMNLVRWQEKGYMLKILKGWYCFPETTERFNIPWLAANLIFQPSCISLESAMSFYGLIPEAVYSVTSVTTRKTNRFETPFGSITYQKIKPGLFPFGQRLLDVTPSSESQPAFTNTRITRKILLTEPEKALLDFFYLNSQYNTRKEIDNLRFDGATLQEMDKERLFRYMQRFGSKSLDSRIIKMLKVYSLN